MESKLQFPFDITQQIIQKIGFIDGFKGRWMEVEQRQNPYLKELRHIATIQSIGSSTRIEGATLTDEEVKKLIQNVQITHFETRDEQEVVGYYDVLEVVLENYTDIDISESNIQHLHNLLLKHSGKDNHHKGKYKQLSNKVVATYPDGAQKTIFNTTQPHLTQAEMGALVSWTRDKLADNSIHSLVVIGTFVYEFLSIHPFQDGNGRLSRVLTTLLLLKAGYNFVEYVSFENLVESKKKDYYQVLMSAQKHRGTKKEVISDWMLFFLSSIESLIRKLEHKYEQFKSVGGYLNDRQKALLDFINKVKTAKVSDVQKHFPDITIYTLKKDMQYLVNANLVDKIGQRKGTFYLAKEK